MLAIADAWRRIFYLMLLITNFSAKIMVVFLRTYPDTSRKWE